jgi:hypothetical protein
LIRPQNAQQQQETVKQDWLQQRLKANQSAKEVAF